MIEPNPVNLKQDIGLPGASEKSRKGKTGKEPEQMMPFACVMGNACRTTTQKTGKIPLNFRSGKGKKSEVRGQKSGVRGQGSEMVDAPELLKLNLKNAVAVKGKGIAESSHGAILKGEATKDINPFMNASKGKDGVRGHGSEVRGQRSEMADAPGLLKFSLKNVFAVKGKSAVEPAMTEKNTEKNSFTPVKSGGKNDIGNSLKHLGLKGEAKAVVRRSVLADEAVKESRSLRAADTVGQNFRNGKNDAALFKDGKNDVVLFKDGGLKKNGAGINNALVRGRRSEVRGQRSELARRQFGGVRGQSAKMEDAPGLLKFSLKNAVAVKGKSAVEPDKTEKNSFTLVKSGGRNDIGNSLKHLGLNVEEAAAWHKKTGVKEFPDHKIEILHKGIPRPERSSDRGFSAGGYHNATFHASGRSSAVNESVNSHGIEPRALINQIASGVKRPGRVRITLNPPRLGTLDVDVLVRDNKVHVMLQPENNDVRQILQSNLESLKSSLRNHGLIADTINVSVQEKSDGANHGSGQSETLFKEGRNRKGNEEDHGGGQDSVNHDPSSFEEENPRVRSDGRISLFV